MLDGESGNGGECLDVNGGSGSTGTAIDIFQCNDTAAQQWGVGIQPFAPYWSAGSVPK
jgi:hypothetical protein